VLTLRARAQSRPPREIHYSHCHTTFPFWMDFDSSVRKTIIKSVCSVCKFCEFRLEWCDKTKKTKQQISCTKWKIFYTSWRSSKSMFLKSYLHATIEGSPRVLSCHTNTSPIFYLGTIPPSHTPHTIPWGYVPLLWYLGEYGKMGFGLKTCQQNNCKRLKELFSNSIISIFRYFVAKLFRQTAV